MGHVACMGGRRDAYRVLVGRPEGKRERDHMEDLGLDGRVIIKWVLKEWGGLD